MAKHARLVVHGSKDEEDRLDSGLEELIRCVKEQSAHCCTKEKRPWDGTDSEEVCSRASVESQEGVNGIGDRGDDGQVTHSEGPSGS
jgi:hypothetical protein